jgi:hypothetical protein
VDLIEEIVAKVFQVTGRELAVKHRLRSLEQADFWDGTHEARVQEVPRGKDPELVQQYPRATIVYRQQGPLNLRVSHYSIAANGELLGLEFLGFEESRGDQSTHEEDGGDESVSSSSISSIAGAKQRLELDPPDWFNASKEGGIAEGDILFTLNGQIMLDLDLREIVKLLKNNRMWPMVLTFARPEEVHAMRGGHSHQEGHSFSSVQSSKGSAVKAVETAAMQQMIEAANLLEKANGQKQKVLERQQLKERAASSKEASSKEASHGKGGSFNEDSFKSVGLSPTRATLGLLSPIPAIASQAKPRLKQPDEHESRSRISQPVPYPSCTSPVTEICGQIQTPKFGVDASEDGENQHYYQVEQNVWDRINGSQHGSQHNSPERKQSDQHQQQPTPADTHVDTPVGVSSRSGQINNSSSIDEPRDPVQKWPHQARLITDLGVADREMTDLEIDRAHSVQHVLQHSTSTHQHSGHTLGRSGCGNGPEVVTLESMNTSTARAVADELCINSPPARRQGSCSKAKVGSSKAKDRSRGGARANTSGEGGGPNVWQWLQLRAIRHPLVGLFRGCDGCNHGMLSGCGSRQSDSEPAVDFTFCEDDEEEEEEQDLSVRGSRQSAPRPCGDGSASILSTRTDSTVVNNANNHRASSENGQQRWWGSRDSAQRTATAASVDTRAADQGRHPTRFGGRGGEGRLEDQQQQPPLPHNPISTDGSGNTSQDRSAANELSNASDQQLLYLLHSDLGGVAQYLNAMSFVTTISRDAQANNSKAAVRGEVAGSCGGAVTNDCARQIVSHRPTFASLQLQVTQGPLDKCTDRNLLQSLNQQTRTNWASLGAMGTAAAINGFILQLNFLVPDWSEQSERLKRRTQREGPDEVEAAVHALGGDGGRSLSPRELSLALSPQTHRALELLAPGIQLPAQPGMHEPGQEYGQPRGQHWGQLPSRGQQLEQVVEQPPRVQPRLTEEALRGLGSPSRGVQTPSSPRSAARLGLTPGESFISV